MKKWINFAWLVVCSYIHKNPPTVPQDPLTMTIGEFFELLVKNGKPIGPDREEVVIRRIITKEERHGIHSHVGDGDLVPIAVFGYRGIAFGIMAMSEKFIVAVQPYEDIHHVASVSGLVNLIHKVSGGDIRHYLNDYPAIKLKEYFADE